MKIITVTGYKGGVSKSTTAIHLATFFSELGTTLLIDGDPNLTAVEWSNRGALPFQVCDQRQAVKFIGGQSFVVIDTPARPSSDDLTELAKGCNLLVLPTAPDVLSFLPTIETTKDIGDSAQYRVLITIVPPRPNTEGMLMRRDLQEAGMPVFNTMIRRSVAFPQAAKAGATVRDMKHDAWSDYESLGKEILTIFNGSKTSPVGATHVV